LFCEWIDLFVYGFVCGLIFNHGWTKGWVDT